MRCIFESLGSKQQGPTLIHVDNDGTICVSNNAVNHARNKHLEEQTWFLREHTAKGNIILQYVPTANNLADILTKPVPLPTFIHIMGLLVNNFADLVAKLKDQKIKELKRNPDDEAKSESST